MKKKVLVYAFGSWGGVARNISEQILNRLEVSVDKLVLPVRFEESRYCDIVAKNYDIIVGLGQYPRGKVVRIERFAYNLYGSRLKGHKPIELYGSEKIELDLKMSETNGSKNSDDPGRFVCNFSMYKLMRLKSKSTKLAFLHIPKQMNVEQAIRVVELLLSQVGVQ